MTRRAWLLGALLVACGGDDADERCVAGETMACELPDGRTGLRACGPDFRWPSGCADVPDGGVFAPDIPWLADGVPPIAPPVLTPCPDGWREVPPAEEGDPATCDPYPEGGALDCPDGQAHFPGEAGCAPVGAPCPTGDFSDMLPTDRRVVHVRPGATMGDGTATRPFGSLTEFSRGGLPIGTVLALSRGDHRGPVRLSRDHELVGACAEATALSAVTPASTEGVVTLIGSGGGLRDLSLSNAPRPGIWIVGSGVAGRVDGVVVSGAGLAAVLADRSTLSLDSVAIRDTAGRVPDGALGHGILVQGAASIEVRRALITGNREIGVGVSFAGSEARLSDAVVRDTREQSSDRRRGRGVAVQEGGAIEVSRALVGGNRDIGVFASTGATVRLSDAVVRDTQSEAATRDAGRGLGVEPGATAEVTRALFSRNRENGVLAVGADTSLSLSHVVILDTEAREIDEGFGRGLGLQLGATGDISRSHLRNGRDLGVVAMNAGSVLRMSDVVVRDTRHRLADGQRGGGVFAHDGAVVEASRLLVSGNREAGVAALGAAMTLEDVAVGGTLHLECAGTTCDQMAGHGIVCHQPGATVRLERFVVHDSTLCGIFLASGAEVDLSNGEVRRNAIGACIQVDDFDVSRLTTSVRYVDNETSLETTTLPLPEVPEPPAGAGP